MPRRKKVENLSLEEMLMKTEQEIKTTEAELKELRLKAKELRKKIEDKQKDEIFSGIFCGHKNNIWWTKITIICIECYTTKHLIHMD
ncbi:hypothetical protein EDD74_13023 [Faecalimonas umbilicata]|uniref:Uncharacterized protein n=1 Tax=Faecalimonas umbilicata TaxID=1912855 RepID=A0A4R3JDY3_9FIRM|nr:flagellar export protein FliJ [Faecalimonas umbilicata]TCS62890.1 hypothetical protein EDD74_13023 [Faecalimonas umbilicata]GBU05754.1 hypothetical protein FAEUMB_22950 [Faecalimonas umbilicata]